MIRTGVEQVCRSSLESLCGRRLGLLANQASTDRHFTHSRDLLRRAYPEKPEAEIEALAMQMWDNMARLAAEYHVAAARQDPELAWKFYDLLFARRADVLKDGEPAIVNAAKDAGLNMKKLAADVKRKDVRAEVDADIAEGQRIGVQGTPYFLINNLVARGALSSDLFKEAINMALQAAPSGQK